MPNIGFGSNKKTKHILPNGFQKFIVSSVKDLDLLLMHNRCGAGVGVGWAVAADWCVGCA